MTTNLHILASKTEPRVRGLRGDAKRAEYIRAQRAWIDYCEVIGSYSGPRGADIRAADYAALARIEATGTFREPREQEDRP